MTRIYSSYSRLGPKTGTGIVLYPIGEDATAAHTLAPVRHHCASQDLDPPEAFAEL